MPRRRGVARTQMTVSPPKDAVDLWMETAAALDLPMVRILELALRRFFDTAPIKTALAAHRAKKETA